MQNIIATPRKFIFFPFPTDSFPIVGDQYIYFKSKAGIQAIKSNKTRDE